MSTPPSAKDHVFETKRSEWIQCLGGDDRNCLLRQAYSIIWNVAAYTIINEARLINTENGLPTHNHMVHRLIDSCYFDSQIVAIRRLMDNYAISGDRGIYSLKGLVADIDKHRYLFTRKNIFASNELPLLYDQHDSRGPDSSDIESDNDIFYRCERLHREVDAIAGTDPDDRSDHDTLSQDFMTAIKAKLGHTNKLCDHATQYLAHAGAPGTPGRLNIDNQKLIYKDLADAHEIVCRSIQLIDCFLLRRRSHGFLASCQFDVFKNIDLPLIATKHISLLRNKWKEYEDVTQTWGDGCIEWLFGNQ